MNDEVLDKRCLYKQPNQYDQGDQNQQNGAGYFPECFQLGVIKCKFMFSVLLRKSNTSKSLNFNNWLPDQALSVKCGRKIDNRLQAIMFIQEYNILRSKF